MSQAKSVFDRLDPDQRAAVELRANGAVSAGAGSGKTTVLAARYLDLVFRSGADVASILCLTFTRKAQAEMQARIYKELSASADPRARPQVERFSEASISTIDSFCSSILRGSAQDYGYAPDFGVDDEAVGALAESEALRYLLAKREDPVLAELFTRMGFELAWKELFSAVAYRFSHPATRPESDFRDMPRRAAAALAAARSLAEGGLQASLAEAREVLAEGQPTTRKGKEAANLVSTLSELGTGLEAKDLGALCGFGLQAFGRSDLETGLKEALKAARESAQRLLSLARAERDAPFEAAVMAHLGAFCAAYGEAKRRRGIMGFRDVAVCAVDLLARRPELRAWYKARYRFIMVDEFQDDDEVQKELLYLLAEKPDSSVQGIPGPGDLAPDKLFFVGDDKQSIYRFRGADVSVFNRLGAELGGEAPRLRTNYRSEPGLIDFFNRVFAQVFGGAEADYEARFSPALARAASPGIEPAVDFLWRPRSADPEAAGLRSDDEALAWSLATYISQAVTTGAIALPDGKGGVRRAGYDDFAVLLRSTAKQYILERFFRLAKIPYTAATVRGLFVESPANDIYAALRLVLLPEDRPSYAAFLRSPLSGLSDDGLVLVLATDAPAFDPGAEAALDPGDRLRFQRGRETFLRLRAGLDRESLASLVSFLWFEAGLRLSILRKPDAHPYLEHYEYLFALAAEADREAQGAAAFLSRLEPLMGNPEKLDDLEVQREAGSGVKVMSVHRSKGLEFPVVVLPWLENSGRREGAGAAFYVSEEAGLTLNLRPWDEPGAATANAFYEGAKDLEAAKARAEVKRLFYVACTRAECRLVLAAVEPYRNDAKGSSFLSLLAGGASLPGPEGGFEALPQGLSLRLVPDLSEVAYLGLTSAAHSLPLESLAQGYAAALPLERQARRTTFTASALTLLHSPEAGGEAQDLPPSAVDGLGLPMNLFGTACHSLIEEGLRGQSLNLDDALAAQVPEAHRELFFSEACRLAKNFLDSPFAQGLKALGRLSSEGGINLALPGGASLVCRLDLLAESETEAVVVDFKSDSQRRPGEYDGQLAAYRAACETLLPGKVVKTYLFWLRSGQAEEVQARLSLGELETKVRAAALLQEETEDEEAIVD